VTCNELYISNHDTISASLNVFESSYPVILIELPSVFALIAPPTSKGVAALHRAKQRQNGKFYGTAIGCFENFLQSANAAYLPDAFKSTNADLSYLEGSFIRLIVTDESISTPAIAGGTHQALLLPSGSLRDYLTQMEFFLNGCRDVSVFPGLSYYALLCTSANLSGDPEGSITDLQKARAFAVARNISLFLRMEEPTIKGGSFPVFSFRKNSCSLQRVGPGATKIIQSLPSSIQITT
jgi:tRNA A37 threonylcarbamoyladenosine synthetase subunit TsaC/SUA5/YrdC